MTSIQGISSSAFTPISATAPVGRVHRGRGAESPQFQASFEKDLSQAGLNSGVSSDDLLSTIQSSIKDAVSDPSNSGKDVVEVIQSAIKETLEENGVDVDKLAELLRADQQAQQSYGPYAPNLSNNSASERPQHDHRRGGAPPGGPPPGGPPPGGPPPSTNDTDGSSSENDTSESSVDWDFSIEISTDVSDSSQTSSISEVSNSSEAASNNLYSPSISQSGIFDTSRQKTRFEQLVANLIQSLPSGSLLDVKA